MQRHLTPDQHFFLFFCYVFVRLGLAIPNKRYLSFSNFAHPELPTLDKVKFEKKNNIVSSRVANHR